MKAGTVEKIKFKRLRAALGLPDWQVIGILESIWQATYHNAPAGDIGRLSNEDIAASIDWTDDPEILVDSLVKTGWLDADPVHRLLVHDWEEHCAAWLRANFARHGKQFARPTTQVTEQPTMQTPMQPTMQGSATLPPILTKPNHTKPSQRDTTVSQKRGGKFTKPTLAEVAAYCTERGNTIEPQSFIDHYETVGWTVGKNRVPMKDWKAAIRTWEAKRREDQPAKPESRVVTPEEFAEMAAQGFNLTTGWGASQ